MNGNDHQQSVYQLLYISVLSETVTTKALESSHCWLDDKNLQQSRIGLLEMLKGMPHNITYDVTHDVMTSFRRTAGARVHKVVWLCSQHHQCHRRRYRHCDNRQWPRTTVESPFYRRTTSRQSSSPRRSAAPRGRHSPEGSLEAVVAPTLRWVSQRCPPRRGAGLVAASSRRGQWCCPDAVVWRPRRHVAVPGTARHRHSPLQPVSSLCGTSTSRWQAHRYVRQPVE